MSIGVKLALVWGALNGVWPFADPDHQDYSLMAVLDLGIHIACSLMLLRLLSEWALRSLGWIDDDESERSTR